jgi:hypothetical protein
MSVCVCCMQPVDRCSLTTANFAQTTQTSPGSFMHPTNSHKYTVLAALHTVGGSFDSCSKPMPTHRCRMPGRHKEG